MKQITLDGNLLADAAQVHDYLKECLKFPEYYGRNLDALHDCLGDLDDVEITITAPDEESAIFQKVLCIFRAADRENESLKIIVL